MEGNENVGQTEPTSDQPQPGSPESTPETETEKQSETVPPASETETPPQPGSEDLAADGDAVVGGVDEE